MIVFGGNSFEHEISILSVNNVLKNIKGNFENIDVAGITRDNEWYLLKDNNEVSKNWLLNANKIESVIKFLKNYNLVFPVMHGAYGEDGRIQSFFELFNINYVGSNSYASHICMDKELTKLIADKFSIKQIPYVVVKKDEKIKNLGIDFPLIIKPANGGSSIGISVANSNKEFKKSIKEAFKYDEKIIVEKFINARDFECAVFEGKKLVVSTIGEIKSCNKFYDFEAKYIKESKTTIPALLDENIIKDIQNLAEKIFKIYNLKDFARIDFLYDDVNKDLYFNEINTIPGFTPISMFPLLFENKGYNFSKVIEEIINHQ